MTTKRAAGAVHVLPTDLRRVLANSVVVHRAWKHLTPLSRNEWICWVLSAKKPETRNRRIVRTYTELKAGKRRPCCWSGCPHRNKL